MPRSAAKGTHDPRRASTFPGSRSDPLLPDLPSALNNLTISTKSPKPSSTAVQKKKPVADSWDAQSSDDSEDEDEEEADEVPALRASSSNPMTIQDYPSAPPPTPMSPTMARSRPADFGAFDSSLSSSNSSQRRPPGASPPSEGIMSSGSASKRSTADVRPEKTTASAARMIAGALGVRAPKRTEEQRQYDKAVREKETKRKEREKEDKKREEAERERAKAAMWDD